MIIPPGATSVSLDILVVDDTGLPVTGLVAATLPTIKYSLAGANADATISLSDLALITTSYTSGGVKERGEGVYRLDVPDAALASAGEVRIRGEATNKRVIYPLITVDYIQSNVIQAAGTAWNSGAITAGTLAADTITAAKIATDAGTEIATAVWATTTRRLSDGTNIVLAKGTGVTGFNDLDEAGIRDAVGLASANLDTQLSTIAGYLDTEVAAILAAVDTEVAAIKAKTDNLPSDPADQSAVDASILAGVSLVLSGVTSDHGSGSYVRNTEPLDSTATQSAAAAALNAYDPPTNAEMVARTLPTADYATATNLGTVLTNTSTIISNLATVDTVVDAIKVVTDNQATMYVLDGAVYQFTANALELAPSDCPTAEEIAIEVDTLLSANHGSGAWGSGGTGGGARQVTITVTDGTDPLEAAHVRMIMGMQNYVGSTDVDGEIVFSVDDGTYTVTVSLFGYTLAPQSLLVNGVETVTYAMTPTVIPPSDPGFITGITYTYDEAGELESGVTIRYRLTRSPSGAGNVYSGDWQSVASDSNGLVSLVNLVPGGYYDFYRGSDTCTTTTKKSLLIPLGAEDGYEIPNFVG